MNKKVVIVSYAAYFRMNLNILNLFKIITDRKVFILKEKLKKEYPNVDFIVDSDFGDGAYLLRHHADLYLIPEQFKSNVDINLLGKGKCVFFNDYNNLDLPEIKSI